MTRLLERLALVIVIMMAATSRGHADDPPPCPGGTLKSDGEFIDSRVLAIRAATLQAIQQRNNTNQTQMPSVSVDSPSLVDESSASDLVGAALNLIGVSSASTDNTSTAATVSAYALQSALTGNDALDPAHYNANAAWRRLSFTLGADFPQDSGNSQAERGIIAGAKYLLYNQRDITSDSAFGPRVEEMLTEVGKGIISVAEDPVVVQALTRARCARPDGEFIDESKIDGPTLQAIDEIVTQRARAAIEYQEKAAALTREVNNRPQVSLQFLTNQRQGDAANNYKGSLIGDLGWNFDLGFADTMALTFNGAYVYDERGGTQSDAQGGMIGAKLRMFQSPTRLDRRVPWTLSLASDAAWKANESPQYRVQGGVSIALWDGVDLPISVSWANQTELVQEDQVIGNVGFTLDTAKLLARLQ